MTEPRTPSEYLTDGEDPERLDPCSDCEWAGDGDSLRITKQCMKCEREVDAMIATMAMANYTGPRGQA